MLLVGSYRNGVLICLVNFDFDLFIYEVNE